jgi:hypothetical protein
MNPDLSKPLLRLLMLLTINMAYGIKAIVTVLMVELNHFCHNFLAIPPFSGIRGLPEKNRKQSICCIVF